MDRIKVKLDMQVTREMVQKKLDEERMLQGLPQVNITRMCVFGMDSSDGSIYVEVGIAHNEDQNAITRAVNLEATKLSNGYSVRLKGVSKEGISLINRYGQWWKIAQQNARENWLMTNYPAKKQGRFAGTSAAMITINVRKDGTDEHVAVVDSIAFPREFVLAEHKGD